MTQRVLIDTDEIVVQAVDDLILCEPLFADVIKHTGVPKLRLRSDGFQTLLQAIVSQQVSVAAANAIWSRLEFENFLDPHKILQTDEGHLKAVGLSRQKIRYAKALAAADLDYMALRKKGDDEVIKILTEVPGIGVWTAEIYAMFSLKRADVFAAGDLALKESARLLFSLDERPNEGQLRVLSKKWSPWRSVAALLLWNYYGFTKNREGVV
jgi:DNA-3-methyladenine glycosylase II